MNKLNSRFPYLMFLLYSVDDAAAATAGTSSTVPEALELAASVSVPSSLPLSPTFLSVAGTNSKLRAWMALRRMSPLTTSECIICKTHTIKLNYSDNNTLAHSLCFRVGSARMCALRTRIESHIATLTYHAHTPSNYTRHR